jgi:hypothetical protein
LPLRGVAEFRLIFIGELLMFEFVRELPMLFELPGMLGGVTLVAFVGIAGTAFVVEFVV